MRITLLWTAAILAGGLGCKQTEFASGSASAPAKKTEIPAAEDPAVKADADADDTADAKDTKKAKADAKATPPVTSAAPETAQIAGSFAVWAQPPNPSPTQDYQLFIEVKLPPNTAAYTMADLTGSITGTDHYSQRLSQSRRSNVPFSVPTFKTGNGTAILAVWVPGAEYRVADTVQVRSALLNEQQSIRIVFQ